MATAKRDVIEIPTINSGEVVEIELKDLSPDNREEVDEVREVLLGVDVSVQAKAGVFLEFAVCLSLFYYSEWVF